MNRTLASLLGLGVATLGVLATVFDPLLTVELAGGGIAIASSGAVALLWMVPRLDARPEPAMAAPQDPLSGFRGAFSKGTLAREQVIYAIQSLEFTSGVRTGSTASPDQVRALLALPPEGFQGWMEARLAALEKET